MSEKWDIVAENEPKLLAGYAEHARTVATALERVSTEELVLILSSMLHPDYFKFAGEQSLGVRTMIRDAAVVAMNTELATRYQKIEIQAKYKS